MGSFTYDASTNRGWVRLKLADTQPETHVFDDEEIDAFLSRGGSVDAAIYLGAQAALAQAARATAARSESSNRGSRTIDDSHRVEAWKGLLVEYSHAAPGRKARVTFDGGRPWDRC